MGYKSNVWMSAGVLRECSAISNYRGVMTPAINKHLVKALAKQRLFLLLLPLLLLCLVSCDQKSTDIAPTTKFYYITNTVTNTETRFVTNTVVKEVPKEIERIVKVPAVIPDDYFNALNFYQRMTNATLVPDTQVLFKLKDVHVEMLLNDESKTIISEDEVRAKFELVLRRNNVPINEHSAYHLLIRIQGLWNDDRHNLLCFKTTFQLYENQWIIRQGEIHTAWLGSWDKGGNYGTVGKAKANEALIKVVESAAEIFANDYLSANPKP